ncbi:TPM domain-containing protein [Actinomyces polynesiensis]|uniref:TPM domain-containing protein n=1 Tax=Actinomyces polynesiensis TaxID=1325934 RepID=UPI000693DF0A|nr:TPM domain-containing protein [Actinomyces polynesiensis]
MRKIHRLAAAGAAALTAMAVAAGPAGATSPVTIGDTVTDPEGFLSTSQVDTIQEDARQAGAEGIDFYFVAVPDLSGEKVVAWCQTSGSQSGLSSSSVVLVIAYEERQIGSCGNEGEQVVTDSDLTSARAAAVDVLGGADPLDAETTTEAVTAFVNSVVDSAGGTTSGTGDDGDNGLEGYTPGEDGAYPSTDTSGGISGFGVLVIVILVVAAGLLLVGAISSRRTRSRIQGGGGGTGSGGAPAPTPAQRVDLANRRLLEADELVRSASDELEFARAQFGSLRTDDYAAALRAAQEGVARAFDLQKQMNDATDTRRQGASADQLLAALDQVMVPLVSQQKAFHDLRDSEATADQQVAGLRERITEVEASLPTAVSELHSLSIAYPPAAIATLQDNPDQARALLDSARQAADQAQGLLSGDRSAALTAVDTGMRAVAMAQLQVRAIMDAQKNLDHAKDDLTQAVASLTSDLNDVTRLHADPQAFAPLVEEARRAVAAAQSAREGSGDPLAALEALHSAEAALDAALAGLRSTEEQRTRAVGNARSRLASAEAAVSEAETFVQSRRGLVDLETRSLMSRAGSSLERARATVDSDPQTSVQAAIDAESTARSVLRSRPGGSDGQGPRSDSGVSWGNLLLWSIFMGNRSGGSWGGGGGGGGHHRGGFGGGGFGGGGFGGGFGGGGGGSFGGGGGGSFGGGGGGGGFGGGGGSSF